MCSKSETHNFFIFLPNYSFSCSGTQPGQIHIEHSRQGDISRKPQAATDRGRGGVTSGTRKQEEVSEGPALMNEGEWILFHVFPPFLRKEMTLVK